MFQTRAKKRSRHLTPSQLHNQTSEILLKSTPTQIHTLLTSIQILTTSVKTIKQLNRLISAATHDVQRLALHNLTQLPSYTKLLQLDLHTPTTTSQFHFPPLYLILATTKNQTNFFKSYLSQHPTTIHPFLSSLLDSLINYNLHNELKSPLIQALQSKPFKKLNLSLCKTATTSNQNHSLKFTILLSCLDRNLFGVGLICSFHPNTAVHFLGLMARTNFYFPFLFNY